MNMSSLQATTTKNKLSPRALTFIGIVAVVLSTIYIGILLATVSSSATGDANIGQSDRPAIVAVKPQTRGDSSEQVGRPSDNTSNASSERASSNSQDQNATNPNQPRTEQNEAQTNTERQNNAVLGLIPGTTPQPKDATKPGNQGNRPDGGSLLDNGIIRVDKDGITSELLNIEIGL